MKTKFYSLVTAFTVILLMLNISANAQQPSITLLYPDDANIEWVQGGTYVISWLDNFQGGVDILISADAGATWSSIETDVTGSTYYYNTTGLAFGKKYRIKVQSHISPQIFDKSSHNFKVVEAVGAFITLNQPTGGEVIPAGSTYLISWNDNLTAPVVVELYKNNAPFMTLATTTGTTYAWTIPSGAWDPGKIYRIKISSSVQGSPTSPALSGKFKIVPSAGTFIEVIQPNGGEKWAQNTTHLISWNDDMPEPVNIELWKGNTLVSMIAQNVTGSTYYWAIDNTLAPSNKYRVYVRSTLDNNLFDRSDHKFSITLSEGSFIEVLQPNGGESWAHNTTHVISWNDDLPEPVNVELWKGNTKVADLATDVYGSTYYWTISDTTATGSKYRVYVRSSLDPNMFDRSDGKFKITASAGNYVEVIQPNGGESWALGNTYVVSWIDDMPEPVNVELWKGNTKVADLATDVYGTTYYWTISDTTVTGNNYRIYVRSTVDPGLFDRSDARFTIAASTGTYIEVYQPNGGETWARGTAHLISWIDDFFEPVNIELWKNNTKVSDIATDVYGSTYVWNIPATQATGNKYRVKVVSTKDATLKDFSDAYFSITASAGTYVSVNQPNGGEVWTMGNSYWIAWDDDIPETVNVELWKNNSKVMDVATDVVGSTYIWTIPNTLSASNKYRIKVVSTLDNSLADFSDSYFEIVAPPLLSAFPNPANENVTISMKNMLGKDHYTIQVFDQYNKLLREFTTSSSMLSMSTSDLANGIYFVTVTSDNQRSTTKVIVVH
jgi:hypothetical protein